MNDVDFHVQVEEILDRLAPLLMSRKIMLVTAESCTGGWIAETVTSRPGSSAWFDRAYVTYSNQAKQDMLTVSPQTLEKYGAVSEPTVAEMLNGALANLKGDSIAVAVSGIAGPDGGSPEKPVGTVYVGWCYSGHPPQIKRYLFDGDRQQVRMQTVVAALAGITEQLC